ncbi:hypothetical protein ACI51Z_02340 [Pectobacterium carotovorum]|uniref:hypothetical protein n=1 Tax=Pectobacterium carotovorum TaxID=554 RepID=UPI001C721197|nr:hypothetical protein [Pectobacterium carotovorum]MCA6965539.1 hypothetical protein [Pectobacterium carotovorum]
MKRLKTSEQVNQNMSYEYKLVFDDASAAQDVMRTIKRSETCIRAENGDVYLKDKSLNNCAEYDVRLIHEDDGSRGFRLTLNLSIFTSLCEKP